MTTKKIEFTNDLDAIVTIAGTGTVDGSYETDLFQIDLALHQQGLLRLSETEVDGSPKTLKVRLDESLEGFPEIAARLAARKEKIASAPQPCDGCRVEFPREQLTLRTVRVGGISRKLPYCQTCAHSLHATVDGYGDTVSTESHHDASGYHKGDQHAE